jgi:hypothetical protein
LKDLHAVLVEDIEAGSRDHDLREQLEGDCIVFIGAQVVLESLHVFLEALDRSTGTLLN